MLEKLTSKNYLKVMLSIALPITLQVLLQSSLSIIDQIMVGSLGETNIASIGFAWKIPTIYFYTIGAIGSTCSILVSQYFGKKEVKEISKSFVTTFIFSLVIAIIFFVITFFFPKPLVSLFTKDNIAIDVATIYLKILSLSIFPYLFFIMICCYLRSIGRVFVPTFSSILSVVVNTALNYCLIFGKFGFKELGTDGAAIASVASTIVETIIILIYFIYVQKKSDIKLEFRIKINKEFLRMSFLIALPLLICEFMWSTGESVYTSIYGHIGTVQSAAMNLIGPVISLSVGLFSGISQASSIIVGNRLGANDKNIAYFIAKKFLLIGFIGSIMIGLIIVLLSNLYTKLYDVQNETKEIIKNLLLMFALVLWIKVSNMIMGGIIRSGGKTKYVMYLDLVGTWLIGVPSGYISAFYFNLSIEWVYLIIAFEELIRLILGIIIFKNKKWCHTLKGNEERKVYD